LYCVFLLHVLRHSEKHAAPKSAQEEKGEVRMNSPIKPESYGSTKKQCSYGCMA
jgi:hypothetical protein